MMAECYQRTHGAINGCSARHAKRLRLRSKMRCIVSKCAAYDSNVEIYDHSVRSMHDSIERSKMRWLASECAVYDSNIGSWDRSVRSMTAVCDLE